MPLKPLAEVLQADPRFARDMMLSGGEWRPVRFEDYYALVQSMELPRNVPDDIHEVFDRARNILLFAWYCYEILIVAEMQAFSALEISLKFRLRLDGWNKKSRGLGHLIAEARLRQFMDPKEEASSGGLDKIDMLINLRNELAHGVASIHNPAMSIKVLEECVEIIRHLFQSL